MVICCLDLLTFFECYLVTLYFVTFFTNKELFFKLVSFYVRLERPDFGRFNCRRDVLVHLTNSK